jgi:hypothetical protein
VFLLAFYLLRKRFLGARQRRTVQAVRPRS